MNENSFETEVAIKKAADAVRKESIRACPGYLVCRLDGLQREVIGFEYRVRPRDRFQLKDEITAAEAEALLHRSFIRHENTILQTYGTFWHTYPAPVRAALLEFSHFFDALLFDRIPGFRIQFLAGHARGMAECIMLAGEVRHSYRWDAMQRRVERICKQLRTGEFVAVEAPEKFAPQKAGQENHREFARKAARTVMAESGGKTVAKRKPRAKRKFKKTVNKK